jgi:uncharacterized membrane protein
MTGQKPQSTAKIAGHPLHPMIIPFPVAAFVATLLADIAFLTTNDPFWFTAGLWLLRFGLVMAALAAVLGLVDFLGEARIRALNAAWLHFLGNVVVVVIEAVNLYMRSGPASVSGAVYLSALAVLLLLFTGWMGWEMVYRHHVGIADEQSR